ncbi:MAG: hypothetical protein H6531_08165 [Actinobacteria bacterium]|nr:hypothetical protein [Thermoleophilia bacterium]MCB9011789.1 hypothetical protein [Actinomycetota bacterium]
MGTSLHYSEGSTRSGAGGGVSENRIPLHYVLVVIGAGMMAGGLWAPWFRINLPDGFFTQAFGAVAAQDQTGFFAAAGANLDQMSRAGALTASGWQVFQQVDFLIAGVAALAVLCIVLTFSHHLHRFPVDLVTFASLGAAGVIVFRGFVNTPGPAELPLSVMWGLWTSLAGCLVVAVGARMSHRP